MELRHRRTMVERKERELHVVSSCPVVPQAQAALQALEKLGYL